MFFCLSVFNSFRTQKNPFLFNMTNKIIFVMFFLQFFSYIFNMLDFRLFLLVEKYYKKDKAKTLMADFVQK